LFAGLNPTFEAASVVFPFALNIDRVTLSHPAIPAEFEKQFLPKIGKKRSSESDLLTCCLFILLTDFSPFQIALL